MSTRLAVSKTLGGPERSDDSDAAEPAANRTYEHCVPHSSSEAIRLDKCSVLDLIVVTTRSSVYELIVLRGDTGDVQVRGGDQFPGFRPVRFMGSTIGGGSLKPRTIEIGWRMEFRVDTSMVVTTSAVQALSVLRPDRDSQVRA